MPDCVEISLRSEASKLKKNDGTEIPFTRAVLTVRNGCDQEITVKPHATLGQEGGTVQDVSPALAHAGAPIPPGGSAVWDVYDFLLPAHQGTASKIHMFGYRAVLNWKFELAVWIEYTISGASEPLRTPEANWSLAWTVPDAASGTVALSIEERKP